MAGQWLRPMVFRLKLIKGNQMARCGKRVGLPPVAVPKGVSRIVVRHCQPYPLRNRSPAPPMKVFFL